MSAGRGSLSGLRILVVEDEMLVAMLIEEMLQALGCEVVGPAATLEDAVAAAKENALDGALLDARLHGKDSAPVAEALRERGVPFLLVTGYGRRDLGPPVLDEAPRVKKPFGMQELAERMEEFFVDSPART